MDDAAKLFRDYQICCHFARGKVNVGVLFPQECFFLFLSNTHED